MPYHPLHSGDDRKACLDAIASLSVYTQRMLHLLEMFDWVFGTDPPSGKQRIELPDGLCNRNRWMYLHWHSRQSVEAQTVLIDAGQPPFPILVDRKKREEDATQLRFWQVEFGTYWGEVADLLEDLQAQRLENSNNLPVRYLNDLVNELQPLVDKLADAIADEQDSRTESCTVRNIRRSGARERQQWYLFAILIQVFSLPKELLSFLDRDAHHRNAAAPKNGEAIDESMQDWRRCQIYLCCHVAEDRRRVPAVDRVCESSARLSPLIGDACVETQHQSYRRVQEIANAFRA